MLTLSDRMPYAAVIMFTFYANGNIMQPFNFAIHWVRLMDYMQHRNFSPKGCSSCYAAEFEHIQ